MLGRLLGLGPRAKDLDSSVDNVHTFNLLFPDPSGLQDGQAFGFPAHPSLVHRPGDFDYVAGQDLDVQKDFRIVIAQDAFGEQDDPCVLLDTADERGPAARAGATQGNGRGHARVASNTPNVLAPEGPLSPGSAQQTRFGGSVRNRSSTISGAPGAFESGSDARDGLKPYLGCMFGSSTLSSKTGSTKMHIAPMSSSSATTQKRNPLVRAHTSGPQPLSAAAHAPDVGTGGQTRDTILITRTFNISVPEPREVGLAEDQEGGAQPNVTSPSYPSPEVNSAGRDSQKRKKLREKRTPAFAVSLLIQLPRRPTEPRPLSRHGMQTKSPRQTCSTANSYGSDIQSSWTLLESMASSQTLVENSDNRIEALVEHFDSISRALSWLERIASKRILSLLLEAELAQPLPKLPKEKGYQRSYGMRILLPYALNNYQALRHASFEAINRIFWALRIPRVVTGFGLSRGGWVEEARFVRQVCGNRDQNFFLFNLLSNFLGSHTDWMALLAPEWHRRRHQMQRRPKKEFDPIISRTVIISAERSMGRRLVFLLASFLPFPTRNDRSASPFRQGFSPSVKHSSQSPPFSSLSRQESLRRTINKKARDNRLAAARPDRQVLSSSATSSNEEGALSFAREVSYQRIHRKESNSYPFRASPMLAVPSADVTSTVTPNTPIVHLSNDGRRDSGLSDGFEVGSPSSLASANLARHLRSGSSGSQRMGEQGAVRRWGSLLSGVSGFWGTSQASSSRTIDGPAAAESQALASPRRGPVKRSRGSESRSILEEIAGELDHDLGVQPESEEQNTSRPSDVPRPRTTPLYTVNQDEGVVDIDIQLPGFLSSSIDSGPASPQPRYARHTPSVTSLDGMASVQSSTSNVQYAALRDTHIQSNVAGHLRRFHPDFALQAVKPYPELEDEVKASMLTETTPENAPLGNAPPAEVGSGQWADICTTLIADARTFSIKRLTLKRKFRLPPEGTGHQPLSPPVSPHEQTSITSTTLPTQSNTLVSSDEPWDETIVSEPVMDFDITLTEAIERILSRTSNSSSRVPSPSRQPHSRNISTSTTSTAQTRPTGTGKDKISLSTEFSRQESRRMVVNALEDVVKSVNDDLNASSNGRYIHTAEIGAATDAAPKPQKHEENALREGVKKWLIDVEHTEVW